MLIDLQLHSTYSDGYLTPTELAEWLSKNKIRVASLADHNTVGGLREFREACQKKGIKQIDGVELYVKYDKKKLNLLWYNLDVDDAELHDMLRDCQKRRRRNVRESLAKLVRRGFKIDIPDILDRYNHYVPVNHVISDIKKNPYNWRKIKRELKSNSPREGEIIHRYFRNKQIGKLRESYIGLERIIDLKKRIGGRLILNHPGKHGFMDIEAWKKLKDMGVSGVEKISPHHSYGAIVYIQDQASQLKWIETGGSDFHRFEGGRGAVQDSWSYFRIDSEQLRGVKKIIG